MAYDQIQRYQIGIEKIENRTRLRLVDLIAHRGEPSHNGAPTHTENSQKITPSFTADPTLDTELLKQENQFLYQRILELEADRMERQAREARWDAERARLKGIIRKGGIFAPTCRYRRKKKGAFQIKVPDKFKGGNFSSDEIIGFMVAKVCRSC